MFVISQSVCSSQIFVSQARAQLSLSGAPLQDGFVILTTNIRPGWKGMPGTNALAFYEHSLIMSVKSFITLRPHNETFFFVIYIGKKARSFQLSLMFAGKTGYYYSGLIPYPQTLNQTVWPSQGQTLQLVWLIVSYKEKSCITFSVRVNAIKLFRCYLNFIPISQNL